MSTACVPRLSCKNIKHLKQLWDSHATNACIALQMDACHRMQTGNTGHCHPRTVLHVCAGKNGLVDDIMQNYVHTLVSQNYIIWCQTCSTLHWAKLLFAKTKYINIIKIKYINAKMQMYVQTYSMSLAVSPVEGKRGKPLGTDHESRLACHIDHATQMYKLWIPNVPISHPK